ncbi:MAG: class I SAM-dependent methyltransferase [Opitutaceae bacterium]|jgi:predicted O-methyltransferase YrrM
MSPLAIEFQRQVAAYANTAEANDRIFAAYTAAAAADPLLAGHRAYVDRHKLGFGDAAFHAMWQQLLATACERFGRVDALEIGVFKGQVVSLWALLARAHGWSVRVHGVTPFEGQPLSGAKWWRALRTRLSPRFRERVHSGDFYPADDYEEIVRKHFGHHELDFNAVRWVRGYSNDPAVLATLRNDRFHVIYIDGGHTYEAASADVANFAPKIAPGGWLVMDDASFDLPGTAFWKGYESVARACRLLPGLGFTNILNVGHNRIFEKA